MTAPTFVEIADEAWSNTRKNSVSVWHLKRMQENFLWCINNRLTCYSHSYMKWNGGSAVQVPMVSTVRWACFGPWVIDVPPFVKAASPGESSTITLRFRYEVGDYPARVYAFSDSETVPTPAQLDAATNSGATGSGAYLAVGSSSVTLDVKVTPGKRQNIWLAVRNERDVNKATVNTTAVSPGNDVFGTVRRGLLPEILARDVGTFGSITSNTAPRLWYAPEQIADDAVEFPYDQCYTVAYADDDADGDGSVRRLMLAEMVNNTTTRFATSDDRAHTFNGYNFSSSELATHVYGTLGTLEITDVLIDQTQEFTNEDRRYWPNSRYKQGASSSRMREILQGIKDIRQHCMPMIGIGLDVRDPDTDATYPGVWETDGGWSGYSVSYVAPYQSATTVADWPLRVENDFRPSDPELALIHIPYYCAEDREDPDITTPISIQATLAVYTAGGGAVSGVTETSSLVVSDLTRWRDSGVPVTHAWIRATQQARSFKLYKDATASGTYGSIFGMDGLTALGDVAAWQVLTIPLDVSSLTASTNYRLRLSIEQTSSTDAPVCIAIGNPTARVATVNP